MSAHPIFEHLFANLGLMKRDERDHEAIHGICIAAEDREWPTEGSLEDDIPGDYFAGVPMPNPISQEDDPS